MTETSMGARSWGPHDVGVLLKTVQSIYLLLKVLATFINTNLFWRFDGGYKYCVEARGLQRNMLSAYKDSDSRKLQYIEGGQPWNLQRSVAALLERQHKVSE
jgi:hypothetical protein